MREFRQRGDAAPVALDGDHACGAGTEQGTSQTAGAGADLEHRASAQVPSGTGDPREQLWVEQEVLAEPLVRPQLKSLDDGAERLQVGRVFTQRRTSTKASLRRSRR